MKDLENKENHAEKSEQNDNADLHSEEVTSNESEVTRTRESESDLQELKKEDAENQSNTREKKTRGAKQKRPKSESKKSIDSTQRKRFPFFLVFNFLLTLLLFAVGGWFYVNFEEKHRELISELNQLHENLASQSISFNGLASKQNAQAGNLSQLSQKDAAIDRRIQGIEQVQTAQNKRLLSISTTSREDWLLAEAEYLLKLANQRVLIEKSATGADALLTEADNILLGLEDPDLFPLRQAIANDLAALRLTKKIDIEGIYLALSALSLSVDELPAKPSRDDIHSQSLEITAENQETPENNWLSTIKTSIAQFQNTVKEYIRITNHAEKPTPILVPELNQYARLNLRLLIEKSQLALLREQQKIYEESITHAMVWLRQYFPDTHEVKAFEEQLERLQDRQVVTQLPDISGSLELIHSYIEKLHNLQGVSRSKGSQ